MRLGNGAVGFILAAFSLLLVSACCPGCGRPDNSVTTTTSTTAPVTPTALSDPVSHLSPDEAALVGTWEGLDKGTDWVEQIVFQFRSDGTFEYSSKGGTVASEEFLTGRFTTEGEHLVLTEVSGTQKDWSSTTESLEGDRTFWYAFDGRLLFLNGVPYHRVSE
jgi:hypothetical protein